MHGKWWKGSLAAAVLLTATPVLGQSCEDLRSDGFVERSVTEQLNAHRACTLELQDRLDALLDDVSTVRERVGKTEDTLQIWEVDRLPIVEAAATQQQAIDAIQVILADSVLAFNRSQRQGSCPRGWSLFEPAGGRMIIGAGRHPNGLTEYPAFADAPARAVGGAESVTLSPTQMPFHKHSGGGESNTEVIEHSPGNSSQLVQGDGIGFRLSAAHVHSISGSGGGEAHYNMPPFIALYFCKKD